MVGQSHVSDFNKLGNIRRLYISPSTYSWLFKYKLYLLPFWILYNYIWWALTFGSIKEAAASILFSSFALKFWIYVVFQLLGVYINLYFLIPRFLEKGKYIIYVALLIITMIATATMIVPGYFLTAYVSGKTFEQMFGTVCCFEIFAKNALPSVVASMTFAMSMTLTRSWIQTKRREQLLEKEKLETELKFLRSQFNPHFLFNTINSIFFLINKNPVKASSSLAKFSDILRYQLYECNEIQIPLSNEITYLENFIELEKLRSENLDIALEIEQQSKQHLAIAPFVLMTFTENAFKHVSRHEDQPNWIRLQLHVNDFQIQFKISNSISSVKSNEVVNYGGIGLKNVKRRLDLMYPDQYELNIISNATTYEVEFNLNLSGVANFQPIHHHA